jgi:hypothetical protein
MLKLAAARGQFDFYGQTLLYRAQIPIAPCAFCFTVSGRTADSATTSARESFALCPAKLA